MHHTSLASLQQDVLAVIVNREFCKMYMLYSKARRFDERAIWLARLDLG